MIVKCNILRVFKNYETHRHRQRVEYILNMTTMAINVNIDKDIKKRLPQNNRSILLDFRTPKIA